MNGSSTLSPSYSKSHTYLFKLPKEIIVDNVLSFLTRNECIHGFGSVCKYFQDILHSDMCAELWNTEKIFQVCIDGYCPTCRRVVDALTVFRCLRKVPIRKVWLSYFISTSFFTISNTCSCWIRLKCTALWRMFLFAWQLYHSEVPPWHPWTWCSRTLLTARR